MEKENLYGNSTINEEDQIQTKGINLLPVISCSNFQVSLWLEFGDVTVGSTERKRFTIFNPNTKATTITLRKCPSDLGFTFFFNTESETGAVRIKPQESIECSVFWTPHTMMAVRETLILKSGERSSLQLILHGNSVGHDFVKHRHGDVNVIPKGIVKESKSRIISSRKPSMSAAKFGSKEYFVGKPNFKTEDATKMSVEDKYLLGWLNLKFGTVRRNSPNLLLIPKEAPQLFLEIEGCPSFSNAIDRVNRAVDNNELSLREDRNIFVDVGLQTLFFDLIFSYDFSWLCLAFGFMFPSEMELLSRHSSGNNCGKLQAGMKNIFMEKILGKKKSKQDSLSVITRGYGAGSGSSKVLDVSRKLFLKTFLQMVLFLDIARNKRILKKPTLFKSTSEYKKTSEVLSGFCKHFLKSEGVFCDHLSQYSYKVSFEQTFVDEFNFEVSDLLDMKDGVRFTRLAEILTQQFDINSSLRVPAVSRLQRIFNVNLAVEKVNSSLDGVEFDSSITKNIADGKISSIRNFLWDLVYQFDIQNYLDKNDVKEEISNLSKTTEFRMSGPSQCDLSPQEELEFWLLQWCQAVCMSRGFSVADLSTGTVNGKILCLVVSYYRPDLISIEHLDSISGSESIFSHSKIFLSKFSKAWGEISIDIPLPALDKIGLSSSKCNILLSHLFKLLVICKVEKKVPHPSRSSQQSVNSTSNFPNFSMKISRNQAAEIIQKWVRQGMKPSSKRETIILNGDFTLPEVNQEIGDELLQESNRLVCSAAVRMTKAAEIIQRSWRSKYLHTREVSSATLIQSLFRRMKAVNLKQTMIRKLLIIQVWLRFHLKVLKQKKRSSEKTFAMKKIKYWWQSRLLRSSFNVQLRGFKKLQALARGFISRSNSELNVREIAKRLRELNSNAKKFPETILINRAMCSLKAIGVKIGLKDATESFTECEFLNFAAEYSTKCCELIANHNGGHILFSLIQSCNRTNHQQQTLRLCLMILLRVCRHNHLTDVIAHSTESVDVMLDLLQMFRDKRAVFGLTCELICRLAVASESIKRRCNSREYKKRLQGILLILERKHRLDSKIQKVVLRQPVHKSIDIEDDHFTSMQPVFVCAAQTSNEKMFDSMDPSLAMLSQLLQLLG